MSAHDQPVDRRSDRATGKDIIVDIVENMRGGQEELLYSSVVPSSFDVHLHASDYDRLEGIFPAITAEARQALDAALRAQNQPAGPGWLRKLQKHTPASVVETTWSIQFFRDENDELRPGDVLIESRLTQPRALDLGGGTRTRRITTSRIGGVRGEAQVSEESVSAPLPPSPMAAAVMTPPPLPPAATAPPVVTVAAPPAVSIVPESPDATTRRVDQTVFATLTYEDRGGRHTHAIREPQTVIGRGGAGYWVDLKVEAAQDVSREHVRLRRDEGSGQFFLKDLSTYGTTVDGVAVPSSIDTAAGGKRDVNLEVPLPAHARIGLAEMVFLEFRLESPPAAPAEPSR